MNVGVYLMFLLATYALLIAPLTLWLKVAGFLALVAIFNVVNGRSVSELLYTVSVNVNLNPLHTPFNELVRCVLYVFTFGVAALFFLPITITCVLLMVMGVVLLVVVFHSMVMTLGGWVFALMLLFTHAFSVVLAFFNHTTPPHTLTLLLPGYTLPLIEGLVVLLITMVVHEGAHALVALMNNVRVKEVGVVFIGPLPVGAFVNLKRFHRLPVNVQAEIAMAGPVANVLLATLVSPLAHHPVFALMLFINLAVGVMNFLPLPLFDGYYIVQTLPVLVLRNVIVSLSVAAFLTLFIPFFIPH